MKKILIYSIFGLGLIMGLKSCIVTTVSIDDYFMGENTEINGQHNRVMLTPDKEMIIVKRYNDIDEIGFFKIKGFEATQYLFGLYCVGSFPFDLRYYHNAEKVLDSDLTLTKKKGESFPKIGKSFNAKIIIFKDRAIIGEQIFKRIILSSKEKEEMIMQIEVLKTVL